MPDDFARELEDAEPNPAAHLLRLAGDPFGVLKRRWLWMLLVLVVGLAATAAVVSVMKPSYQATARVLISAQQIPEDFVRSTVRESSLENLNAMIGEILTQRNLSNLIDSHDLYPELKNQATRGELVQRVRGDITITPAAQVSRSRNPTAAIFQVSFIHGDPTAAASVANDLASLFVDVSIEQRSAQARYTTGFLKGELERSEAELREINQAISEFQRNNRGELPSDLESNLRRLERLEQQREMLMLQINQRDERILVLSGVKDAPASEGPHQELSALRSRLMLELGVSTEDHPNVQSLRQRIALMEQQLSEEDGLGVGVPSPRSAQLEVETSERKVLRDQLAAARMQIEETDARVDRIPAKAERLTALQQRAEVLRDTYLDFLRKVQDAELAESLESAQQGPRVSVLDRAQPPSEPMRPPLLILIAGIVASFGIAAAIAVLFEMLDPVVLGTEQLVQLTSSRSLGSLPQL